MITLNIARDVGILRLCVLRILRRIGQCAQNWPSCSRVNKATQKLQNVADFVLQYCC